MVSGWLRGRSASTELPQSGTEGSESSVGAASEASKDLGQRKPRVQVNSVEILYLGGLGRLQPRTVLSLQWVGSLNAGRQSGRQEPSREISMTYYVRY